MSEKIYHTLSIELIFLAIKSLKSEKKKDIFIKGFYSVSFVPTLFHFYIFEDLSNLKLPFGAIYGREVAMSASIFFSFF